MSDPPRDEAGRVIPHDDPEIPNESHVLRLIPSHWLIPNEGGGRRLSSGAFSHTSKNRDPYEGMSVDLAYLMLRDGIPESGRVIPRFEGCVRIGVGLLRENGFKVGPDPRMDNPYHGNVWGVKRQHREFFLEKLEWAVKPAGIVG